MKRAFLLIALLMVSGSVFAQTTTPVPALMNFQGRLAKPDGTPVSDGTYSIRFSFWTAATNGTEKWNQTINPVNVKNGTFAVLLSGFGAGTFNGNLWLEIKVGTTPPLTPRQQLVSVAYAMKANSVPDGSIGTAQIANGSIIADKFASNIFNPLAWLLGGNLGSDPTKNFLGTTDNQSLELRVNNIRALRIEPAKSIYDMTNGYYYLGSNVISGYSGNSVTNGVVGATIGGGYFDSHGSVANPNIVTDVGGTVSGGTGNRAGDNAGTVFDAPYATVGGGFGNIAGGLSSTVSGGANNTANGSTTTIGGGGGNTVTGTGATVAGGVSLYAIANYATVSGGTGNTAKADFSTIGGGTQNVASGNHTTIGGGQYNTASGDSTTVSGGYNNKATDSIATIGGGVSNQASGIAATIPGGRSNIASGEASFAAGSYAQAQNAYTFVWSDHVSGYFTSVKDHTFIVSASGGFGINTASPGATLDVNGSIYIANNQAIAGNSGNNIGYLDIARVGFGNELTIGHGNNAYLQFVTGGTNGVPSMFIANGGNVGIGTNTPAYTLDVNGTIRGNNVNPSDARYKTHISTLPNALDAILNLRGVSFDWKRDEFKEKAFPQGRQVGFIAQEVEKILPELVSTDTSGYKSVAYSNVAPVLVEAIKAQQKQIEELKAQLRQRNSQQTQIDELKQQIADLRAAMKQNAARRP